MAPVVLQTKREEVSMSKGLNGAGAKEGGEWKEFHQRIHVKKHFSISLLGMNPGKRYTNHIAPIVSFE